MGKSKLQFSNDKYLKKVKTIDSIIEALYDVISGHKGQVRDWNLFKFLFHPDAKLIPYEKDLEGIIRARYLSPDDYINTIGKWLETKRDTDFYENEIHKVVNTFRNISQVFSTYESFHNKLDEKPYMRGVNSFQLLNHHNRWWIINIYWARETPENPIPKEYLPK